MHQSLSTGWTRNSSVGPFTGIDPTVHHTKNGRSTTELHHVVKCPLLLRCLVVATPRGGHIEGFRVKTSVPRLVQQRPWMVDIIFLLNMKKKG